MSNSTKQRNLRVEDFILGHCEFSGSFVRCPDEYNCFWIGYLDDNSGFLPTIGAFYERVRTIIESHVESDHR